MFARNNASFVSFAALVASVVVLTLTYMMFCLFSIQKDIGTKKAAEAMPVRSVPTGYSAERYSVAERMDRACVRDEDCALPMHYALQSNCPYAAWCINRQCTIVCPQHQP